jgi:hypothetical protein
VARTQHAALAAAPGGTPAATVGPGKGVSAGTIGAAALVVAVLALAVATPALLRRRRRPAPPSTRTAPGADRSDGDPVDDPRQKGG